MDRNEIWRAMLNADMNARYWKRLVQRYAGRDKALKIFTAIMASGTVAGWGFWEDLPGIWKTLSALSALAAIVMPILNHPKMIKEMSSLAGKWGELKAEYEDLWLQISQGANTAKLNAPFRKFRKSGQSLQAKEVQLPVDDALLKKCRDDVLIARGLA